MTVPGVYSPEQAALQAHVDKVIASDGVDDSRAVEVMARALAEIDCSRLRKRGIITEVKPWRSFWEEADAALGALRALEGEN